MCTLQPHVVPSGLTLLAAHLLPSTGLALLCTSSKGLVVLTGGNIQPEFLFFMYIFTYLHVYVHLFQILVFNLIMEFPLLQTKNMSISQKHLQPSLWGWKTPI